MRKMTSQNMDRIALHALQIFHSTENFKSNGSRVSTKMRQLLTQPGGGVGFLQIAHEPVKIFMLMGLKWLNTELKKPKILN